MKLSVLDQSTILSGRSPDASIRETLALARHAEACGYHRYWLAEHHNSDAVAGSAPEVLIGAIAATTQRIRVGSAGVMLPHYSALHVAEQFRVLEAIAPGRIDLGLGRAPGSDGLTAHALNPNAATAADQFPTQVRDLLAWVGGEKLAERHPFRDIVAEPTGPTVPEVWILGSSDYGAQVAAHFGLPYCFAYFITDGAGAAEALDLYRRTYRSSARHPAPYATVCLWAAVSDTQEGADQMFASRALWWLGRNRGRFTPLPSPEEAVAWPYTDQEHAQIERLRNRSFHGTPAAVATRLRGVAADLGIDEVAVLTTSHDPAMRMRSYALLAKTMGVAPPQPDANRLEVGALAAD